MGSWNQLAFPISVETHVDNNREILLLFPLVMVHLHLQKVTETKSR